MAQWLKEVVALVEDRVPHVHNHAERLFQEI